MARKVGKIKRIVMLDRNGFLGVPPDTPIKFLMTADTFDFLERSAAAMAIDRGQLLMSIVVGEYLNPERAVLLRTAEGVIGDGYLTVELASHNGADNSWPHVRTFSVSQKGQLPPGKLELLIRYRTRQGQARVCRTPPPRGNGRVIAIELCAELRVIDRRRRSG